MAGLAAAPWRLRWVLAAVLCALILIPLTSLVGAAVGNLYLAALGGAGLSADGRWFSVLLNDWVPRFLAGLIAGLLAMGAVRMLFRRRAGLAGVGWITVALCFAGGAAIVISAWPHLTFDHRFIGFLSFGLGLVLGLLAIERSRSQSPTSL